MNIITFENVPDWLKDMYIEVCLVNKIDMIDLIISHDPIYQDYTMMYGELEENHFCILIPYMSLHEFSNFGEDNSKYMLLLGICHELTHHIERHKKWNFNENLYSSEIKQYYSIHEEMKCDEHAMEMIYNYLQFKLKYNIFQIHYTQSQRLAFKFSESLGQLIGHPKPIDRIKFNLDYMKKYFKW